MWLGITVIINTDLKPRLAVNSSMLRQLFGSDDRVSCL
jgi:hypothetical protein